MKRVFCLAFACLLIAGCAGSSKSIDLSKYPPGTTIDEHGNIMEPAPEPAPAVMYDLDGNPLSDAIEVEQASAEDGPMMDRAQALSMLKVAYANEDGVEYDISYDEASDVYFVKIKASSVAKTALASSLGTEPHATNWRNICEAAIGIDEDARELLATLGYPDSHVSVCIVNDENTANILFSTFNGAVITDAGRSQ